MTVRSVLVSPYADSLPIGRSLMETFNTTFCVLFFYLKEMGLFIKDRKEIWQLKGVIAINELEVLETSKLEVK